MVVQGRKAIYGRQIVMRCTADMHKREAATNDEAPSTELDGMELLAQEIDSV